MAQKHPAKRVSTIKSLTSSLRDTDPALPLAEHLRELRRRVLVSFAMLACAFVPCFYFASEIFTLLLYPFTVASGDGMPISMIFTAPHEFFFTQLKLALFGALCVSFPMLAFQLYRFVAPGLYARERRAFLPFLLAAPLLFSLGVGLVYFVIMPLALQFFLNTQIEDGAMAIRMVNRVSEYLSFAMTLMVAFGLCFQLPIILMLLARAGVVSAADLSHARRYAIVGIFGLAALVTPPDIISQLGLGLPLLILYEASILGVRWFVGRGGGDD